MYFNGCHKQHTGIMLQYALPPLMRRSKGKLPTLWAKDIHPDWSSRLPHNDVLKQGVNGLRDGARSDRRSAFHMQGYRS